jgi:hypothetical protein
MRVEKPIEKPKCQMCPEVFGNEAKYLWANPNPKNPLAKLNICAVCAIYFTTKDAELVKL